MGMLINKREEDFLIFIFIIDFCILNLVIIILSF